MPWTAAKASSHGWELADALRSPRSRHGSKPAPSGARLAGASPPSAMRDLIVLHDPAGNRLEFFHGRKPRPSRSCPGRNISGFRTGPLGMGHVVLHVDSIDRVMPFYRELLGFG